MPCVSKCLLCLCGTYGNIYCDNLLNLTTDEMTTSLTPVHLSSKCPPNAYLAIFPGLSSDCISGGKIQTAIMRFSFGFLLSALIPFVCWRSWKSTWCHILTKRRFCVTVVELRSIKNSCYAFNFAIKQLPKLPFETECTTAASTYG